MYVRKISDCDDPYRSYYRVTGRQTHIPVATPLYIVHCRSISTVQTSRLLIVITDTKQQQKMTSATNTSGNAQEDENTDLLQAWRESSQERPLRVLICGQGGVGKSTLINQLLQLEGEGRAEEGIKGGAMTTAVSKYETTTKSGVKVCLFDSPGFGDVDIKDETTIAMMVHKTEKKLDMFFYCIGLNGSARVQQGDIQAIKKVTGVFTEKIWKNAIIVLTFANVFEERVANVEEYNATISRITEKYDKSSETMLVSVKT